MGQIVRSIQGITKACKELDYPVVSGNVSLYNETDGNAIQPTPAIGGVGLLTDFNKRCDSKFKKINDEIFIIGKSLGHISCSLYEREILGIDTKKNPPKVDLSEEKKNSEFIREIIANNIINACHDISDGGLMIALFEMSTKQLGCKINISSLNKSNIDENNLLYGEDQSRYVVSLDSSSVKEFIKFADKFKVEYNKIGEVANEFIEYNQAKIAVAELIKKTQAVFVEKFS